MIDGEVDCREEHHLSMLNLERIDGVSDSRGDVERFDVGCRQLG